jgi:hypothetical protein
LPELSASVSSSSVLVNSICGPTSSKVSTSLALLFSGVGSSPNTLSSAALAVFSILGDTAAMGLSTLTAKTSAVTRRQPEAMS